ncbi:uncharacterized protein LOC119165678 isoform X9 [Rhipicephalus microplus]|uniref:uncharacterized protein LOC119165678 isoform X9 n=1 Tax=Rhipicephalus microplus TaxID=6941 RepID=UPI003F6C977A
MLPRKNMKLLQRTCLGPGKTKGCYKLHVSPYNASLRSRGEKEKLRIIRSGSVVQPQNMYRRNHFLIWHW